MSLCLEAGEGKKSGIKKCEHTSLLSIELSRFCAFLETKKDEDIQNLQIKKRLYICSIWYAEMVFSKCH